MRLWERSEGKTVLRVLPSGRGNGVEGIMIELNDIAKVIDPISPHYGKRFHVMARVQLPYFSTGAGLRGVVLYPGENAGEFIVILESRCEASSAWVER